jgi:hypothetical protein
MKINYRLEYYLNIYHQYFYQICLLLLAVETTFEILKNGCLTFSHSRD